MGVIKLQTESDEAILLWGILTGCSGHRLCWEINQAGNYGLARGEDLKVVRNSPAGDTFFSYYRFDDVEEGYYLELIGNHSGGEYFMSELRNFDFLLMVKGELDFFDKQVFASLLKGIACIRSAMPIDDRKLKLRQQLILE